MLQIPLRRSSRTFVCINTTEPSKRTFLLKPLDTLESMPKTSTQIESDNNVKRYARRPGTLETCCLAEFMSQYEAKSRKYQGVFEVKSRLKTWQIRGIRSQQLEH